MSPLSLGSVGPFHGENLSLLILIVKATLILIGALGVTLAMQRAAADEKLSELPCSCAQVPAAARAIPPMMAARRTPLRT